MSEMVLLGDEAVALGAVHAGLTAAYAYPGTPSTEITEYLIRYQQKHGGPRAQWCANEKTAYEAALGVSFAGRRALVSMKHVGLNVAADPFMNSALVHVNGGLVVAVADDPGMHSSQNEQDSRYFADFARVDLLRAGVAPGGLRDDARGVRRVRALPHPRGHPPGDAPGPQPRHRADARRAPREPAAPGHDAGVVDPAARQRAQAVAGAAGPHGRHPALRGRVAAQPRRRRARRLRRHHDRAGAQLLPRERARPAGPAAAPAHRRVPVPGRDDPRVRRDALARARARGGLPVRRAGAARHRAAAVRHRGPRVGPRARPTAS